jgi:NAD(P)-dependent dehydrogenase (short-subunit alcohol dehydrogenase family)
MKILVVGAGGTLGKAIVANLGARHEVLGAGRNSGDYRVDLRDDDSVRAMFTAVGKVDAIVAATGSVHFGALDDMSAAQFDIGLQDKLLGQVRLALVGQHHVNDGGSITLTSGVLSEHPIRLGANATAVNAAVDGFVRAAACELPRGIRINAVSATVFAEAWDAYQDYFQGFEPIPVARAALAFQRSIEGIRSGHVFKVW